MSRKMKPVLPDVDVVHDVIRLADALVAAERRSTTAWDLPRPGLPEYVALFDYLTQLPDVRMTELHALFWTGVQLSSTARAFDSFYQHALRNLDHGAAYLAARPLGKALSQRPGEARPAARPDPYAARRQTATRNSCGGLRR